MPMISGGHGTERGGAQARPLPRPNAAPCGRWCEPRPLPDVAEGLLGLYPDVALAPEEVEPQQPLLGGERRGWASGSPGAALAWGWGRDQCHRRATREEGKVVSQLPGCLGQNQRCLENMESTPLSE